MTTETNIEIIEGNLRDEQHAENFLRLTSAYMTDPMGEAMVWDDQQRKDVINNMKDHPCAVVLFAKAQGKFVGLCTCFYAYSTFLAKPLMNIHDIYVEESARGLGVGTQLVQAIGDIAAKKNCGKITLEVRKDNLNARDLYKGQGFHEAPHSMFFWVKTL